MELARRPTFDPPPVDDRDVVTDTCTSKQDVFAVVWADTGNQAAAYRKAYKPSERCAPGTLWANASRIAALPHVRKRYEEHRQQLVLETIMSVREAFAWQIDIATADPAEIVYVAKRSCRHCYGEGHKYQWEDSDEYIAATIKALDAEKDPPSDAGGYGYARGREPNPVCPKCLGNGHEETVINDTRNLVGKARKLFKGVDYKNGVPVVQMHDQSKAWDMALRMLGAFNDKLDLHTPGERSKGSVIPDGVTEQDAARAYLTFVAG